MSVGAAIRVTSRHEARVIEHAAEYARRQQARYYVFSIVQTVPYGALTEAEREAVRQNLKLIERAGATPVMQEGSEVARTLLAVARYFEVQMLFLGSGGSRTQGRSIAEQLIYLDPPFDVVVIGSE